MVFFRSPRAQLVGCFRLNQLFLNTPSKSLLQKPCDQYAFRHFIQSALRVHSNKKKNPSPIHPE